jgi:large repetitive protein
MPLAVPAWNRAWAWFTILMLSLLAACGDGGEDDTAAPAPVAPTLEIGSDVPGTATGPVTLSFEFSAAVSGFAANRILISGGFLNGAGLTQLSDTRYSLVVTPTPGKVGVIEVTVPAGAFKDSTGVAASTRAYGFSQGYDTVVVSNEPLLSISNDASSGLASGPITFTLNFSVEVPFSLAQVLVSGGTVTSFTQESGTRYALVVTPPAATTGLVLLQVPEGAFSSTAGVPSQQAYAVAVLYATP